jgi:hypothetical protein
MNDRFEERLGEALKAASQQHEAPVDALRVADRISRLQRPSPHFGGVLRALALAVALVGVVLAVVVSRSSLVSPGASFAASPSGALIGVRTQAPTPAVGTPPACMAALISGLLVADQGEGLVLRQDSGIRRPVIWPNGYAVRLNKDRLELLDSDGIVVAREGDYVTLAGGERGSGNPSPWLSCGPPDVVPRPSQ